MILGVSDMGRVANTARHRLDLFLHLLLIVMVATAALIVFVGVLEFGFQLPIELG